VSSKSALGMITTIHARQIEIVLLHFLWQINIYLRGIKDQLVSLKDKLFKLFWSKLLNNLVLNSTIFILMNIITLLNQIFIE